MKRFDIRVAIGLFLLLLGGAALAQQMGYFHDTIHIIWGTVFLAGGLSFFTLLFSGQWWAAFPSFPLLALGAMILLPKPLGDFGGTLFLGSVALSFWWAYFTARGERWWAIIPAGVLTALAVMIVIAEYFEDFGGAIFLGGMGLAFFGVYLTERAERWWALIPGGVLCTLAGVTIVGQQMEEKFDTAGFFFFGLALTFLLVALLANMRWAYWPALVLGIMGALAMASLLQIVNYLYAAAFIAGGGYLLYKYFSNR